MRSFLLTMLVLYAGISLVVVSSSHAEPAAPTVHGEWQYKVVHASFVVSIKDLLGKRENAISDFEKQFNELGKERWELCEEMDGYLVFKRPK